MSARPNSLVTRLLARLVLIALAGPSGAWAAEGGSAPPEPDAAGLSAPPLKAVPELMPPNSRPAPSKAAPAPSASMPTMTPIASPTTTMPTTIPPAPVTDAPKAPEIPAPSFGASGGGSIFLRAGNLEGIAEKYVEASDKVELRSRDETVLADWLRYDFLRDEIWGKGNVVLRKGIDYVTGPEVRFRRSDQTGFFKEPRFFLGENGGRVSASEIRFVAPEQYEVSDASYTTCTAPREDWFVRAAELEIDKSRMVGTGHHATVNFFNVPIAYTPWIEFPLSGARKSGLLTPTLGSSELRGFDASFPYYFNLAPNYDATVTPRVMTKRGVQIGAQFRYLYDSGQGGIEAEDLPHDRVTGTDRYGVAFKHFQNLGALLPGLTASVNLNKVSDDTYFSDLSDRVSYTSLTTLPREGALNYVNGPWTARFSAQAFQTLQDPNQPVVAPYNRVPQLLGLLQETDWMGLTWSGSGEYADFRQPTLTTGQRAYLWPNVAWSRQGSAWSFTAKTGAHMRQYNLNEIQPGVPSIQNYAIPISSLDGSLVFERDWNINGRDFVHTLEPRAFYVYVPYRNQQQAPVFDTALDDYNFGQLFSVNRYLGNDRIGDANQLTLAVTSRLIDPGTGAERLRVSIGERFYFVNQRVVLNETPRSAATSDMLLGVEGKLTEAWSLLGLWQYNFDASQTEALNAGFRYMPAPGRVFNAAYTYANQYSSWSGGQGTLNQFDLSAQWPLGLSWTLLGRWNYSLQDRKTLEGVLGVEYNAGCWALRLVGQRLTTTTQTTSNSVYLQLELTGLARFGTSPLEMLRRSVPGYMRTNDPTVSPRETGSFFPEF